MREASLPLMVINNKNSSSKSSRLPSTRTCLLSSELNCRSRSWDGKDDRQTRFKREGDKRGWGERGLQDAQSMSSALPPEILTVRHRGKAVAPHPTGLPGTGPQVAK